MTTIITSQSYSVVRYLNPFRFTLSLWQQRNLIVQFTQREISNRYRGTFLGIIWSFINPFLLLMIYTFVFGVVLKQRWPQAASDSLNEFAITLFCGLIAFGIFSECMSRSSSIIVSSPNYVKKVVFPLEILPITIMGAALFQALINFIVLIAVYAVTMGVVQWTLILTPIILLPLVFLTLGLMWFISSLSVFFRDAGYIVALLVQVLTFLTPVFYPLAAIPASFRMYVHYSPLALIVETFRNTTLWGILPGFRGYLLLNIATIMVMMFGYAWFMKTKKAFADVI